MLLNLKIIAKMLFSRCDGHFSSCPSPSYQRYAKEVDWIILDSTIKLNTYLLIYNICACARGERVDYI